MGDSQFDRSVLTLGVKNGLATGKTWCARTIVFHPSSYPWNATDVSPTPIMPQMLLIRRAANTSNPNKWEPPGGRMKVGEDVKGCLERELTEETKLQMGEVIAQLKDMSFKAYPSGWEFRFMNFIVEVQDKKDDPDAEQQAEHESTIIAADHVQPVRYGETVNLEEPKVTLDPDQHTSAMWATEEQVENIEFTSETKDVVLDAFKWWKDTFMHDAEAMNEHEEEIVGQGGKQKLEGEGKEEGKTVGVEGKLEDEKEVGDKKIEEEKKVDEEKKGVEEKDGVEEENKEGNSHD